MAIHMGETFEDFRDGAVGRSVRIFPYGGCGYVSCMVYDDDTNSWQDCADDISKGWVFVNEVSDNGRGGAWVIEGIWHDDSNYYSYAVEVEFPPSDADAVLQFIG